MHFKVETRHGLRLDFCNQVGHDFALVLSNVHEILFCACKLINGRQYTFGGATNLLNVGLAIDEVKNLNFTTIVEEHLLLLVVGLAFVEPRHLVDMRNDTNQLANLVVNVSCLYS